VGMIEGKDEFGAESSNGADVMSSSRLFQT